RRAHRAVPHGRAPGPGRGVVAPQGLLQGLAVLVLISDSRRCATPEHRLPIAKGEASVRNKRATGLLAVLLALGLIAAACGGGNDNNERTSGTSGTSTKTVQNVPG